MAYPLQLHLGSRDEAAWGSSLPAATEYLVAAWTPGSSGPVGGVGRRTLVIPADLAARVRLRDVEAFDTLVHLAYVPLVHFACGYLGSIENAEDVVQDVLAAVWERAERWAPSGNPATYLFGMVRHHAIDAVRRLTSERRRSTLRIVGDDEGGNNSPEQLLLDAEEHLRGDARLRALQELIEAMSERQRTAYDLRYRQGMTVAEVGVILGITTKSAEQLIGRLVRAIRERMRELEGRRE